jgi:hypothetical protein
MSVRKNINILSGQNTLEIPKQAKKKIDCVINYMLHLNCTLLRKGVMWQCFDISYGGIKFSR